MQHALETRGRLHGSGILLTRRAFVLYASSAVAALSLAGCSATPKAASQSSGDTPAHEGQGPADNEEEPLDVADKAAAPEDMGPPRRLARFAVIADTHVTASFQPGVAHTRAAFQAITQFDPAPDAIIVNGDLTDHGLPEEYDLVSQLAAEAGLQFPESFVVAMGNHEQRGANGENTPETYREHRAVFLERCNLSNLYYDLEVGGQHLIVLGPDADPAAWWTFRLSPEQLAWLDGQLARDAEQNRRSFVFLHQPADGTVMFTHEGEFAYQSLESSAELLAVVSKYRDAILLTGHSHSPNDFQRPNPEGPLFVANSAVAYLRTDAHDGTVGDTGASRGLIMDVFTDRVEFISWDYALGDEAETGRFQL